MKPLNRKLEETLRCDADSGTRRINDWKERLVTIGSALFTICPHNSMCSAVAGDAQLRTCLLTGIICVCEDVNLIDPTMALAS